MKSFKLMNYTSNVPALKSILDIERLLTRAGANKIAKDYLEDGTVTAFIFAIQTNAGNMLFRMPVDTDKVCAALMKDIKRPHRGTRERVKEQAERVAWRIMLDWINAQITMIRLDQVKPEQAFMPYMYDAKSRMTLFEKLEKNQFKMLGTGNSE